MAANRKKLVLIGSGWAGYKLSQNVDEKRYDVTVISPCTTFAYTPLLASAACGLFDFRQAEEPIRRKSRHITFIKALVKDVEFKKKSLRCEPAFAALKDREFDVEYDILVFAPGCRINTFDTPGVEKHAFMVKNVADAVAVRNWLSDLLEMAALPTTSDERRRELLHIAVVGGGPTGIEMAAELSELLHDDLSALYPQLTGMASVAIHDVAPQILAPFEKELSEYATKSLRDSRIELKVESHIVKVTKKFIETEEDGKIPYGMLIWATGNKSVPLVDSLDAAKSEDGLTRVLTDSQLRLLRADGSMIPDVYALGDAADIKGDSMPTTAEVAVQKANYLLKLLNSSKETNTAFRYQQKAMVAYTGQKDGVIQGQGEYTGQSAWLSWRSGNVFWTDSWRRRVMLCTHYFWNWLDGREIARK